MWWWLSACNPATSVPVGDDDDDLHSATVPPAPLAATLSVSPFAPAAFRVSVDAPAGRARVVYGLDGALDQETPALVVDGPAELPLVGLKAHRSYTWQVVVDREDGEVSTSEPAVLDTPAAPDDLPLFELVVSEPEAQVPQGYVLLNRYGEGGVSHVVVLDGDGDVVWWAPDDGGEHRILRARPAADGRGVVFLENDPTQLLDRGTIVRLSFDGTERGTTAAPDAHHDFNEVGDGRFAWLASRKTTLDVPGQGPTPVTSDQLRVIAEGESDRTAFEVLFDVEADYPVAPWDPCAHTNGTGFVRGYHEWTHANSLVRAADGDGWWLNLRYVDGLLRLGEDGSLRGQLGGRDGTWTLAAEDAPTHAHLSTAVPGALYVFDNGWSHSSPPEETRLLELSVDEGATTAVAVWSTPDPVDGGHTDYLGDLVPLGDGEHLLTSWPATARVVELDRSGRVLWRAEARNSTVGRIHPLATLYAP